MQVFYVFACLALTASATSEVASPIQKVVQMLSDLQTKVIGEGTDAQKVYNEFAEFCETRSRDLQFEIKTGNSNVNSLKATIAQESALIESLTGKIEELTGAIATDEADLKAAVNIRDKEAAVFAAEDKELSETIDTLGRASTIIEREMQKGGAAMVQMKNAGSIVQALSVLIQASEINSADGQRLTALLQNTQESNDDGAPAGAVYESQSGNILDVLNDLREKAEGQLADARAKEGANMRNFQLLQQSLEDEVKFGEKDMAKAKKGKAASAEKKAGAEGDLEVTSKDLAEDEKALADLHRDCMARAEDFEAETKSRGEELEAIATAKKVILESTGGAAELSYSFLQLKRSSEVAPLASVRFVRDLSKKTNSPILAQLAFQMASVTGSTDDIFAKVKGLISEMIARLEEEGEADATKKAWCDKELAETDEKNADKTAEIAKMTTNIDQMSARSAQLKEQVAELSKQLAALAAAQAQMDTIRAEEKAAFKTNSAEMAEGVTGVKLALKVLRDYYAADSAHAQADGAAQGIIGLLEVVESDFTKGLAEMVSSEEAAAADYDKETKENEIEKATKDQDVKYKNQESASLDKSTAEETSDRAGVQTELDAVHEYLKSLHEQCDEKAETYSDRKARRASEIDGLKQALEILEGESALLQTASSRSLRKVRVHA